ncbi:hypothetical protein A2U01_0045378, partial [Trifolium medium]|nr:hypothetical protein [Trifolium medium]
MGPKKGTTSKKAKTGAGTSRVTSPFDAERFSNLEQFERFQELQKRKIWPEKQFDLTPDGQFRQFLVAMDNRNWGKLLNPPSAINVDLVREFYANSMPIHDEPYSFTTMVRGRALGFDRDAINEYLGNPYQLEGDDGLCPYGRELARGNWNVQAMTEKLLM